MGEEWECAGTSEAGINPQGSVHLFKGCLRLFEESVDNTPGEFPLIFIIIHLQYLFEGKGIDGVAEIRRASRASVGLWETSQHAGPRL